MTNTQIEKQTNDKVRIKDIKSTIIAYLENQGEKVDKRLSLNRLRNVYKDRYTEYFQNIDLPKTNANLLDQAELTDYDENLDQIEYKEKTHINDIVDSYTTKQKPTKQSKNKKENEQKPTKIKLDKITVTKNNDNNDNNNNNNDKNNDNNDKINDNNSDIELDLNSNDIHAIYPCNCNYDKIELLINNNFNVLFSKLNDIEEQLEKLKTHTIINLTI